MNHRLALVSNLLNSLVGLVLVYAAVITPQWTEHAGTLAGLGALVLLLALFALPSSILAWQPWTNALLGLAVLALAAAERLTPLPQPLRFWVVFWSGMIVAVFALWSALYRTPLPTRA